MDTYKCSKCQQDIKNDERDNHELNCIYTFSTQEYQDLIPCEICDNLINFEDYQTHVTDCMNRGYLPIPLESGNFDKKLSTTSSGFLIKKQLVNLNIHWLSNES